MKNKHSYLSLCMCCLAVIFLSGSALAGLPEIGVVIHCANDADCNNPDTLRLYLRNDCYKYACGPEGTCIISDNMPADTACRAFDTCYTDSRCDVLGRCVPNASSPIDENFCGTNVPPCANAASIKCDASTRNQCVYNNLPDTTTCRAQRAACDIKENCTGASPNCPNDALSSGNACRESAGVCDSEERCNGTALDCPANGFLSAGTLCRRSAGPCDLAENCTGLGAVCPDDRFNTGASCNDGNFCTTGETCNASGICSGSTPTDCSDGLSCTSDGCADSACTHSINAGACLINGVCYAAGDTNPSAICEVCDPARSQTAWSPKSAGTVCRPAASICDIAETCDGVHGACPADAFESPATECRPASGPCDVAEMCTGSSAVCPSDAVQPAARVCRLSGGACDTAETCTGSGKDCPADAKVAAGTVCRAAAGDCDTVEVCNGSNPACPADVFAPASTVCRAAAGECDAAENCTGSQASCPVNTLLPVSTVCRPSAGECDIAEVCDGQAPSCPVNVFRAIGTACTDEGNICTNDTCNGSDSTCKHPLVADGTTCADTDRCNGEETCGSGVCGAGTPLNCDDSNPCTDDICDEASGCKHTNNTAPCDDGDACTSGDICTAGTCAGAREPRCNCLDMQDHCWIGGVCYASGAAQDGNPCAVCDPNTSRTEWSPAAAGVACRNAAGPCDAAEVCNGLATTCPADEFSPGTNICRPAAGPCDAVEYCTGLAPQCPADAFLPAGEICSPKSVACDIEDRCTGTGAACVAGGTITEFDGGADGCCPEGGNNTLDPNCSASCGNGAVEPPSESCDPPASCPTTCDDGIACTADSLSGEAQQCNVRCEHTQISACAAGDGCCPAGCNTNTDADCAPVCGNGTVETDELCDGNCSSTCDDSNSCTTDSRTGDASTCNVVCSHAAISQCLGGDGCCPAACNALNDSDCSSTCGNGVIEPRETCDGNCESSCDDQSACTTDVMTGSAENCNVACSHNPVIACANGDGCCPAGCNAVNDSDCAPVCGNNVVEPNEMCDGNCPSCSDSNACTIDTQTGTAGECNLVCAHAEVTACGDSDGCCPAGCSHRNDPDCSPTCGNAVLDPGETCDPQVAGGCPTFEGCNDGNACTIDGILGSAANCSAVCTHRNITVCGLSDGCCPAACDRTRDEDCTAICGNQIKEPGEACDTSNTGCIASQHCENCACVQNIEPPPPPPPPPVPEIRPSCITYCEGASARIKELNSDISAITGWQGELFCEPEVARAIVVCTYPVTTPEARAAVQNQLSQAGTEIYPWMLIQKSGRGIIAADPAWRERRAAPIARPVLLMPITPANATKALVLPRLSSSDPLSGYLPLSNVTAAQNPDGRFSINGEVITHDSAYSPSVTEPFTLTSSTAGQIDVGMLPDLANAQPELVAQMPAIRDVYTFVLTGYASFTGLEGAPEDVKPIEDRQYDKNALFDRLAEIRAEADREGRPVTPDRLTNLPWEPADTMQFAAVRSLGSVAAAATEAPHISFAAETVAPLPAASTEDIKEANFTVLTGIFEEAGGGGGCNIIEGKRPEFASVLLFLFALMPLVALAYARIRRRQK